MARCRRYALLGAHPVDVGDGLESVGDFVDAFDAVAELDDGRLVVVGLRTGGYVEASPEPEWPNGYRPLPITLDFEAVQFYDFSEIFWLGPDPQSCLIWCNAVGLRNEGIDHLLSAREGSRLLDGPNRQGLPHPDELGLDVPNDLVWRVVDEPAGAGPAG